MRPRITNEALEAIYPLGRKAIPLVYSIMNSHYNGISLMQVYAMMYTRTSSRRGLRLARPASRGPLPLLVRTRRSVQLAQNGVLEVLLDTVSVGLRRSVVDREHGHGGLACRRSDQSLARQATVSRNAGVDTDGSREVTPSL